MELIADGLLIVAAAVAGVYCIVLARRLHRLSDLDSGVGGAIAQLSRQVTELKSTLDAAKRGATGSARTLEDAVARATAAADRLERLIAVETAQASAREAADDRAEPASAQPADGFMPADPVGPVQEAEGAIPITREEWEGDPPPDPEEPARDDVRRALRDLLGALNSERNPV
ncbi:MAG: hypothetical protein AAFW69_09710 [Pseudomonadota bacterium]